MADQDTRLAFGQRYQEAGIQPSMGLVGNAYDNMMAGGFLSHVRMLERLMQARIGMRRELLPKVPELGSPMHLAELKQVVDSLIRGDSKP